MKLSFYGAAGEVTGSCSLLQTKTKKILVDCGAFQGGEFVEERNADPFVFDPKELSAVIVTHAHLDHIGRLPQLVRGGFGGFIYATAPTIDLTRLVLEDAFEIMHYNNKKFGTPVLYTLEDVAQTMGRFKAVEYYVSHDASLPGEPAEDKIAFKFYDAGHIFGSAFVEIKAEGKTIVFSGDVGSVKVPIIRDTDDLPDKVDLLVCESTYGDRLHDTRRNRQEVIEQAVRNAANRGGTLLVPAFSVERTQEILYDLNDLIDRRHELPNVPIFLDSPLAIDATEVFRHYEKYFDEEAKDYILTDDDLFNFKGLTICRTREESKKINAVHGRKIIIAGAGMMNGGRILHHAMRYLSDERTTLFFTGFQAPHTLGRKILEGQSPVNIFGEQIHVRCHIEFADVLSAHADKAKLFDWIKNKGSAPKLVCLNHGEPLQSTPLKERLEKELGIRAELASPEKSVEF